MSAIEQGFADIHNHVIPAVDDGAHDIDESRAALHAMWEVGVRTVVATPHFDASLVRWPDRFAARLAELDRGWHQLTKNGGPPAARLRLERGAEVKLDTPEPDLSDERLRLAGTSFVLVEFPYFAVPPRSEEVVRQIRSQGWNPVIAHPERYRDVGSKLDILGTWRDAGAYLQVNGASLVGRYGPEARSAAFELLSRGWVDYLASDFHSRGRTRIDDYRDAARHLAGAEITELLMRTNPQRLLDNDAPLPVPPVSARPPFWKRLGALFR